MATPEQADLIEEFRRVFPAAYSVEDVMRLCLHLKVERELLIKELEELKEPPKKRNYDHIYPPNRYHGD